jgi:hypothetical protein
MKQRGEKEGAQHHHIPPYCADHLPQDVQNIQTLLPSRAGSQPHFYSLTCDPPLRSHSHTDPLFGEEILCPGVQLQALSGTLPLPRNNKLLANPTTTGGRTPTIMAYNNQPQDNRNPNRLQLNFGFQNTPGQTFTSEQARQFPTTPSTFPQPFPNAAGQQEVWGTQTPQQPGLNPQGYFNNFNPYGSQLQQGQGQGQVQTPGVPGPAPNAYRSPGPGQGFNEVTNGFAQQMNLGGNTPRSASPYARNASPANGRPRTAGDRAQPYASYLNAPVPGQPQQPSIYDEQVPPKNPEKYSAAITERVRHQKMLTGEFFKENVERAKTRNERYAHHTAKL